MSAEGERFRMLAAVGEIADGSTLLGETARRLLDIVVPAFADVATLDTLSPEGRLRRLGARAQTPEAEAMLMGRVQVADASAGVMRAIATGEAQLLSPIPGGHLRTITRGEADLEALQGLGLRSIMYVPLRARGRIVGALACSTSTSGRLLTADDLHFAEVLGGRLALALDAAGLSETVTGLERRMEAILSNLTAAVVVRDPAGRMVYANPAAAELLGAPSVDELMVMAAGELMADYEAYDERGRALALEDLPSARALRGERAPPLVVRNVTRATGEVRWLLHTATPVLDGEGELSLAINVIEDVTETKRAELAAGLLAEAGRELAASLDYQQTLQHVASLAVPELADWCGVSMVGAGDVLHQVAVAHVDPEKVTLAREWGERYPARLSDPAGPAEVIRTGRSQLVPRISEDLLAEVDVGAEQLAFVRQLQVRSVIVVPLAVPGRRPSGVLTLVMADSGRTFDETDLAMAEELARRAAAAVENARLYTERSRIATTLQRSLLPPALPDVPGFRLASLYRPAGEASEVGGDFYDAFSVPGGWMVVVGDVAGHGAEAAALTSLSRYTLRTAARLLGDPGRAVQELNAALRSQPQLSLVSVSCAVLREADGEAFADILLAGHPPGFHLRAGEVAEVGTLSPLLGIDEQGVWPAWTLRLDPGDLLVLYTDGVTDTFGETERFGEERLARTLRAALDADEVVHLVDRALSDFGRGPQRDDTAVLAVQRVPALVRAVR